MCRRRLDGRCASSLCTLTLEGQQLLLALDSPSVPAQVSILANHSMTGNRYSNAIPGAGLRYGASRFRFADSIGHLAVGACGAVGNGLQVFPDAALEGRGLNIEWQSRVQLVSAQAVEQSLFPGAQATVIALALGKGELVLEILLQLWLGIAEPDRAESLVSGRHQHAS